MRLPGAEPDEAAKAVQALGTVGVTADKAAEALQVLATAINQLHAELVEILTVDYGGMGHVVRLPLSRQWVVAGRWLVRDDDVATPRGFRGWALSRMVRDVRSGRLLPDGGF